MTESSTSNPVRSGPLQPQWDEALFVDPEPSEAVAEAPDVGVCIDCGEPTPGLDLLFSERGRVCIDCHGEAEVAHVDLSPWHHAVPTLAMIGTLTALAVGLPQIAQLVVYFGPTGALAWAVMNLLPATLGGFLTIAALRLLRDAWTNPLDEDLPFAAWVLRLSTSALAVVASAVSTVVFPIMALWPFL